MKTKTCFTIGVLFAVVSMLAAQNIFAAPIGKMYVTTAEPDAGEFVDVSLADSVKDIHRIGGRKDFEMVGSVDDAEFLLVVISREEDFLDRGQKSKRLTVTISMRDGDAWKPGVRISKFNRTGWSLAADDVLKEVKKWINNQSKK